MWPWRKRENGECLVQDPMDDPTSLPRILCDLSFIDRDDVQRALEFQKSNTDMMFGAALVELDLVDQGVVDAVLYIQKAIRDKNADVVEIMNYVNKQAEQVQRMHEGVQKVYAAHFGGKLVHEG